MSTVAMTSVADSVSSAVLAEVYGLHRAAAGPVVVSGSADGAATADGVVVRVRGGSGGRPRALRVVDECSGAVVCELVCETSPENGGPTLTVGIPYADYPTSLRPVLADALAGVRDAVRAAGGSVRGSVRGPPSLSSLLASSRPSSAACPASA